MKTRAFILFFVMLLAQAVQSGVGLGVAEGCATSATPSCCSMLHCTCCVTDHQSKQQEPLLPAPPANRTVAPDAAYVMTTMAVVPSMTNHDNEKHRVADTRSRMHRTDGVSLSVLHCSFLL